MAEKENKELKETKEEKVESSEEDKQLFTITTKNIWKITTVVLAIIIIALLIQNVKYKKLAEGTDTVPTEERDGTEQPTTLIDMAISDADNMKGDENAPITIIEYSDFQCPYCKRFYEQTFSSIETNYVDTGKVKVVFRHFPLSFHQNAEIAAEAAECAGEQDKFWEMHDILFESGSGDGTGLSADDVKGYASELGLDTTQFNTCVDSSKYAEKIESDMKAGIAAGVGGTPAFVINGHLVVGAQPYAVFQAAIDTALAE